MRRVAIAGVAAALVLVSGFYFLPWQTGIRLPGPDGRNVMPTDLGVTYLPLTAKLSAYYGLGVDSGALVTEVAPGSPADRAGVKAGDVILSFNGSRVEQEVSLLQMMRAWSAESDIELEVYRGKSRQIIQLAHTR